MLGLLSVLGPITLPDGTTWGWLPHDYTPPGEEPGPDEEIIEEYSFGKIHWTQARPDNGQPGWYFDNDLTVSVGGTWLIDENENDSLVVSMMSVAFHRHHLDHHPRPNRQHRRHRQRGVGGWERG